MLCPSSVSHIDTRLLSYLKRCRSSWSLGILHSLTVQIGCQPIVPDIWMPSSFIRGTPFIMSSVDDLASACLVSKTIKAQDMSRSSVYKLKETIKLRKTLTRSRVHGIVSGDPILRFLTSPRPLFCRIFPEESREVPWMIPHVRRSLSRWCSLALCLPRFSKNSQSILLLSVCLPSQSRVTTGRLYSH